MKGSQDRFCFYAFLSRRSRGCLFLLFSALLIAYCVLGYFYYLNFGLAGSTGAKRMEVVIVSREHAPKPPPKSTVITPARGATLKDAEKQKLETRRERSSCSILLPIVLSLYRDKYVIQFVKANAGGARSAAGNEVWFPDPMSRDKKIARPAP